jgi:ubiquitin-protein ligase
VEKLLIENQFTELSKKYCGLHLSETTDEEYSFIIKGSLSFEVLAEQYPIADIFDLEIKISKSYPLILPKVSEMANRIPRINKYHINSDGTFCLASRRREYEMFYQFPSFMVVPFIVTKRLTS